jgi:hypothetical protein
MGFPERSVDRSNVVRVTVDRPSCQATVALHSVDIVLDATD